MGILEALEQKVKAGEQPARSFYVAFGHDEEVNGYDGAGVIAKVLKGIMEERNESLSFVLDEGLMPVTGAYPGLLGDDPPVAAVGVAEKGYMTVNLTVTGEQGHSSMPPRQTVIGILARAISRLESNPIPAILSRPLRDTFRYLSGDADFANRLIFSNLWLFSPALSSVLSGDKVSDALQRTTTAVTVIDGGIKDNVLPSAASAIINFRVNLGDDEECIINRIKVLLVQHILLY